MSTAPPAPVPLDASPGPLRRLAVRRSRSLDGELREDALIVAPHQDDETLACGGTIMRIREAGAEVTIVFLTDGSASHPRLIAGHRLRAIRAEEAVAAAGVLGVERARVLFLDFPDGRLVDHRPEAARRMSEVLARLQPAQVFIPCRWETHDDHWAAHRIMEQALRDAQATTVYEYPVWFWRTWPWIRLSRTTLRATLGTVRRGVLSGARLLSHFRWSVAVGDVLDRKRRALDQYRSQMTRLLPDDRWWTLQDVGNGDFLRCFLQNSELFIRARG